MERLLGNVHFRFSLFKYHYRYCTSGPASAASKLRAFAACSFRCSGNTIASYLGLACGGVPPPALAGLSRSSRLSCDWPSKCTADCAVRCTSLSKPGQAPGQTPAQTPAPALALLLPPTPVLTDDCKLGWPSRPPESLPDAATPELAQRSRSHRQDDPGRLRVRWGRGRKCG